MVKKNNIDLGFVIDKEGYIYNVPTFYKDHFLNYDLMVRELGICYTNKELEKRNDIGYRELPLYKLANEGFVCIINFGYENNDYLGIYVDEKCEINYKQKEVLMEKKEYIESYKNHELNLVPKIEKIPSLKEVGTIKLNINNTHNAIFDLLNNKTKIKNRR